MKLSEAILLGSTLSPQAFEVWWTDGGGSCALGAALQAVGIERGPRRNLDQNWPWLIKHSSHACPACHAYDRHENLTEFIITHLNDEHKWTRERIAEWVSIIEPQEPSEQVDPSELILMEVSR